MGQSSYITIQVKPTFAFDPYFECLTHILQICSKMRPRGGHFCRVFSSTIWPPRGGSFVCAVLEANLLLFALRFSRYANKFFYAIFFLTKIFYMLNFFLPHKFFYAKNFVTQIFFDQKILLRKIFLTQNFFLRNFFFTQIFFTQKFFLRKIFFYTKIFLTQNFFYAKFFFTK